MTIELGFSTLILIVVASITGLTRAIPYFLFGGKKELPKTVHYLGTVLPASIMIILVVYCLRNINFTTFPFGMGELLSVGIVIAAQVTKKNAFLSIFLGTACYMILIRTVLPI
ncbi:branched-chain amino acid transporter permease [Alkaliphilus peptidifermentans]|uniref:Branched-chain amino acid transport protein AzlD n=1 Tax=Alkaliphilus peptidifermentans DSM 18978 TaxID=1120976 RepID=A0A1G5BS86_9FIRM|nr:AzlD domain-containing protein [Alkaliphilus peptidifermentans]SCX93001.1 Branched-chain amino acid transport protein AzlD [Alkaliphilus peptidifermentans DSM 18978]